MSIKLFTVSAAVLLLDLAVLLAMLKSGAVGLGILLLFSTFAVFGSGFIWLIAREDQSAHFLYPWRVIPCLLWGTALAIAFNKGQTSIAVIPETLNEVGLLLGSRYLIGVWVLSVVILATFVTLVSLSARGGKSQ